MLPKKHSELPDVDFATIRASHGSQRGGFEECCVQIFREERGGPFDVTRIEGAGGDGGVEAFGESSTHQIIGLQAKYLHELKPVQWKQIDKSVHTALRNYPYLVEYVVCVPLDRNPSQLKRWKELVKKWHKIRRKHKVKFVWWGKSELSHLLTEDKHQLRLRYWFGCRTYSREWLKDQNDLAIKSLDTRYTPKNHVKTRTEYVLDAFCCTDAFCNSYYDCARSLVMAYRDICFARVSKTEASLQALIKKLNEDWSQLESKMGDGKYTPRLTSIIPLHSAFHQASTELYKVLDDMHRVLKKPDAFCSADSSVSYARHGLGKLLSKSTEFHAFLNDYACADSQKMLLVGSAGTGKSHLLANLVESAQQESSVAILLIGGDLLSNTDPWKQILDLIRWDGTVTDFLAALNCDGEITGKPAIICIDALNESNERSLWRSHLDRFAAALKKFPRVRLIVSCRSDFASITLPPALADHRDITWSYVEHQGFGEQLFKAVTIYFNGYNIQTDSFPPLLPEFENPLFLKTLCETYENSRLPAGTVSFDDLMKRRVKKLADKLLHDIDCPREITESAIISLAKAISDNKGDPVDKDLAYRQVEALLPGRGVSQSLYYHLHSNGMFVEVVSRGARTGQPHLAVRFPYERFSDYFIADHMLKGLASRKDIKTAQEVGGPLDWIGDRNQFWARRGICGALSVMLPERYGIELSEIISDSELRDDALGLFLESLPWRNPSSFTKKSNAVLRQSQKLGLDSFLQALLTVSTVPSHPYNADFLSACLLRMTLPKREQVWTLPLSDMTFWGGNSRPELLIRWGFDVPLKHIYGDQLRLIAKAFTWLFTSNHRGFRRRAILACIRVLDGRASMAAELIEYFHQNNDPYLVEGVFAVAAGVAMRAKECSELEKLAYAVYHAVFSGKYVPPNILIRDYAQCVLEVARNRKCLPSSIAIKKYLPPYSSIWPNIWAEPRARRLEKQDGWRTISSSVQPECTMNYGDFGRYVMGSALSQFLCVPINKSLPPQKSRREFDHMIGRRWILQRVYEFGWRPELFGKYEQSLPWHGRQRVDIESLRGERISKKYQWIALRELQGYLSDHYRLSNRFGDGLKKFEGAWQLWARDIDPSQPLIDLSGESADDSKPERPSSNQRQWWEQGYPDPFLDKSLCSCRKRWVSTAIIDDFRPLIEVDNTDHNDLLTMGGHYSWKEPLPFNKTREDDGQLEMWIHLRSWLVDKKRLADFLRSSQRTHFFGHGCDLPHFGSGWIGEYPWGRSFAGLKECLVQSKDEWLPDSAPRAVHTLCVTERENNYAILPSPSLINILEVRWSGQQYEYVDSGNNLVCFCPSNGNEAAPCFVSRPHLEQALNSNSLAIVWGLVGERTCWDGNRHITGIVSQFSAVYYLKQNKILGGITKHLVLTVPKA